MKTKRSATATAVAFLAFGASLALFCFLAFSLSKFFSSFGDSEASASPPVTIVIDAGHGGEDGGASSADGICEKHLNLEISLILGDIFSAAGYNVIQTRSEDVLLYDRNADYKGRKKILDMAARLDIAEKNDAAIFISIHMNSFPQSIYRGLQVYYSPNHPLSKVGAEAIQQKVKDHLQAQNNREVKPSGGKIYLLDRLTVPAVLVECGFLSNPEEAALLTQKDYQRKIAFLIFAGVEDQLSPHGLPSA